MTEGLEEERRRELNHKDTGVCVCVCEASRTHSHRYRCVCVCVCVHQRCCELTQVAYCLLQVDYSLFFYKKCHNASIYQRRREVTYPDISRCHLDGTVSVCIRGRERRRELTLPLLIQWAEHLGVRALRAIATRR